VPAKAILFRPQTAVRVRWNMNTDTPLPPEEPAGENPPDGAMIDYYLAAPAVGPVTLEILDASGAVVRSYSSEDRVEQPDPLPAIPQYWVRPPHPLRADAGMHRFLWDMHWTPLSRGGYGMEAIAHDTPQSIVSVWAMPGRYTVRLRAGGQEYTQPLTLKMDPRVKTPQAGLLQQYTLAKALYDDTLKLRDALVQLRALRARTKAVKVQGDAAAALVALDRDAAALEGAGAGGGRGGRGGAAAGPLTLTSAPAALGGLLRALESADVEPTTQLAAAAADRRAAAARLLTQWTSLKTTRLAELNAALVRANLPAIQP
jgi:hypothetical protein